MPADDEFGHWTTYEERAQELHNRLVAWWVSGEEWKEIWADAARRFNEKMEEFTASSMAIFDSPMTLMVECFEAAFTAYDTILAACPEEE